MPRVCSICHHRDRAEIDRALLRADSYRHIASRFGTSTTALQRHKAEHLGDRMAEAAERNAEADVRTAIDVVKQLKAINSVALGVLRDARSAGDGMLTLQATDRILKQIELQAKLIDLISDGTTVNVIVSPEWVELRTAIVACLHPYPEARQAVTTALQTIEGGSHVHVA